MAEPNADAARQQMINGQLRTSDVNERGILEAFAAVDRAAYVAPAQAGRAYADGDVAAAGPAGRKLLRPRTLGLLLKCAAPQAGERALVVGGGGYCAALLAAMGLDVVDLETEFVGPALARVERVAGPLDQAPPGKGPFDVVVLNGAFEVVPDSLIGALKEGGRFVGVDARAGAKQIVVIERSGDAISERGAYDAAAETLPGFAKKPQFLF